MGQRPTGGRIRGWLALAIALAAFTVSSGLLGAAPASAALAAYGYDASAYVYDGPAQRSSPDTAASYARGSPSGPEATSRGRSVSVGDRGVAANSVPAVAPRVLTAAEQRSVASLQQQVATHAEKLAAYRANPAAYDNLGILERAPTPAIRQQIIDGRIRHLETEIRGFQNQIDKLLGGSG